MKACKPACAGTLHRSEEIERCSEPRGGGRNSEVQDHAEEHERRKGQNPSQPSLSVPNPLDNGDYIDREEVREIDEGRQGLPDGCPGLGTDVEMVLEGNGWIPPESEDPVNGDDPASVADGLRGDASRVPRDLCSGHQLSTADRVLE